MTGGVTDDSAPAAEEDGAPLLLSGAEQRSYGGIHQSAGRARDAAPPLPTPATPGPDVVNHGHVYSDAVAAVHKNESDRDGAPPEEGVELSYWSLVKDHENFRWFLMSYLVTHAGEWLTYVASISAIEQIHASKNITSRTSISILVSLRLLPNVAFSSIGGVLADSYDRRRVLLTLDVIGSLVALTFLLAYRWRSVAGLYVANALQMTVAAIYEQSRTSIVPMLVPGEDGLKKATTISVVAWSVMASVGSSMGGFVVEYLGISPCFCIDSLSYLLSALFVWRIRGRYLATETESAVTGDNNNGKKSATSLSQFTSMFKEGISYLCSKPWGSHVFFKPCAALLFGAGDVLNVSFSERGNHGNAADDAMGGSSQRLGILFGAVGIGCFLGPIIIDHFTHMDQAESLKRACLGSYFVMAIGWYGLSNVESFLWVCVFTSVRSAGSSVAWVNSSLLLQKFSADNMLGRVMSVDYTLTTMTEALSAMASGMLQDDVGLAAEQVSFLMAVLALGVTAIWGGYLSVCV